MSATAPTTEPEPQPRRDGAQARYADLTCLGIVTDPDLFAQFLQCAATHPGLSCDDVVRAVCTGKGRAALLLPERGGDDSWTKRHARVKEGARPLKATVTEGDTRRKRRLFSEYDLVQSAENVVRPDDLPRPRLETASTDDNVAMALALERIGDVSQDVANALTLKFGIRLTPDALGCPEAADVELARARCQLAVDGLGEVPADFPSILEECRRWVGKMGGTKDDAPAEPGPAAGQGMLAEAMRRVRDDQRGGPDRDGEGDRPEPAGERPRWADGAGEVPPPDELFGYFVGKG